MNEVDDGTPQRDLTISVPPEPTAPAGISIEVPVPPAAADPEPLAPAATAAAAAEAEAEPADVVMTDAPAPEPSPLSPAPVPSAVNAPSPSVPVRIGTPSRLSNNGLDAGMAQADPGFVMPAEAAPHGDPTRRYLNSKVVGPLLEGMKQIARDQPYDPLRALGEFLLQKSRELEK